MKSIIKWYEYVMIWSALILIIASSLLYSDRIEQFILSNPVLSEYGVDIFLLTMTLIIFLIPVIERYIISHRINLDSLVKYRHFSTGDLLFVVFWMIGSISILVILISVSSTIKPYYLFGGIIWGYRGLIVNRIYYGNYELIIGNKLIILYKDTSIKDAVGNDLVFTSKGRSLDISCHSRFIKKKVIGILEDFSIQTFENTPNGRTSDNK